MKLVLRFSPFASLVLLLPLELVLAYDTLTRKLALMTTAVVVIIALSIFSRSHAARNNPALASSVFWLASIGVWFDAIGNFQNFYGRFAWWDQVSHGVGTAALALGILLLIQHAEQRQTLRLGRVLRVVFAVSIAMTFSALYEISEYLGDQLFPTHRITDLYDTADDLLWNFLVTLAATSIVSGRKNRFDEAE